MQKKPVSIVTTKENKKEQQKAAARDAINHMLSLLPEQIQIYGIQAQALRAKFDALKKEGFTDDQALEIVKTRPIFE